MMGVALNRYLPGGNAMLVTKPNTGSISYAAFLPLQFLMKATHDLPPGCPVLLEA